MTPEEQRAALAEWEGWRRYIIPLHGPDGLITEKRNMVRWTAPGETLQVNPYWNRQECPDYLSDLNAVHELEGKLDQNQCQAYTEHLASSTQDGTWAGCSMWHISAAQRCEAILKTLNLWKP